jgi:acyl-CoA thioesterase I
MAAAMMEGLVQFAHLDKEYGYVPGADESRLAAFFGCPGVRGDKAPVQQARSGCGTRTPWRTVFRRKRGRPGQTVLALRDSFTDDLQSWFEIVRHLFDQRRPGDGVRFVNAAISGYTTAMALRRLVPTISSRPDWIICCLGGNDVTRIGPEPNKPTVSLDATARKICRRYGASLGHSPQHAWSG